jgi:hypothetical protein
MEDMEEEEEEEEEEEVKEEVDEKPAKKPRYAPATEQHGGLSALVSGMFAPIINTLRGVLSG